MVAAKRRDLIKGNHGAQRTRADHRCTLVPATGFEILLVTARLRLAAKPGRATANDCGLDNAGASLYANHPAVCPLHARVTIGVRLPVTVVAHLSNPSRRLLAV